MNVSQYMPPPLAAQSSITKQQQYNNHHRIVMSSNQNFYEDYGQTEFNNSTRHLQIQGSGNQSPSLTNCNVKPINLHTSNDMPIIAHHQYYSTGKNLNNFSASTTSSIDEIYNSMPPPPPNFQLTQQLSCFPASSSNYYNNCDPISSCDMIASPLSARSDAGSEDDYGRSSQMISQSQQQCNWYQPPEQRAEYNSIINMLQVKQSNGREARNRAEKNRRDKLNGSIQELSTMVPHVAESPRRVDKTAVLRFSAHGMRIDYVFGKSGSSSTQQRFNNPLTDALLQLLNSFLLTITCKGQIVLVSPSIEQHLGHCQTDLFGQNLLNLTHPDDAATLRAQLIPTDLENLFDIQPDDETGKPRPRTQAEEEEIDRKLREDKRNFTIRLARAGQRSDPTIYEAVRIDGCFRRADSAPRGAKTSTFPTGLPMVRRVRGRDDSLPLHTISGNDIILVAMAQVIKSPSICERLFEATKFEYKTRHLIDGRIVQCDQRISIVAGYMADEVSGLSPFTFMHKDDVRWVMVALRQMYDYGSPYGESCYRLMARTGQFIYLKTRGFLDIDRETNQVKSFICLNTLISEDEGRKLIHEMKKKFAIMIQENEYASIECDEPAVENPLQLERAILSLITNLHGGRSGGGGGGGDCSISGDCDENMVSSPIESYYSDDQQSDTKSLRSVKSPPLSLIAPKSDTIKDSIQNSVKIITNATRLRTPDIGSPPPLSATKSPSPAPMNNSPSTIVPPPPQQQQPKTAAIISSSTDNENQKRPSVVQKIENFQPTINRMQHQQQVISPASPPSSFISSSTRSLSSCSNSSNISSCQSVLIDVSTNINAIKIKEEPISDCRVPPLPTSARYFSAESTTTYMMPSSSSESVYDYGDISSNQSQQHHEHYSRQPSQHPYHQHHHYPNPELDYNYKGNQRDYDSTQCRVTNTMLKRTHSYEMTDNSAKRRYQNTYDSSQDMMTSSIIRMGDNVPLNRQTQYNAYGPESECHRYDEGNPDQQQSLHQPIQHSIKNEYQLGYLPDGNPCTSPSSSINELDPPHYNEP